MYGCCSGPAEAQGDYNSQLPGWLARSSQFLGTGDSSQRLSPSPPLGAWPPAEWPEERAHSTQQTTFLGVCLDSTSMQARLDPTRVESSKSYSARFRLGRHMSVGLCRKLLGLALDGWFPLRMGCSFWGQAGLRCTGKYLTWHINCLEIRAAHLALIPFLRFRVHSHVIVRTDLVVVSHINRQGGSRLCTHDRHVCQLLLWAQDTFLSLRVLHVPGVLNLAADFLWRQKLRSGEWMLNCWTEDQIWESHKSTQWPLWFSLGIEICGRFQSGNTCCVSSSVEFGTHVQRSGSCGYGQSDVVHSLWSLRWSLDY